MTEKNEYCKGCVGCYGIYNRDGYCPCGSCLIKMICRKECNDYCHFSDILTTAVNCVGRGSANQEQVADKVKEEMEKLKSG